MLIYGVNPVLEALRSGRVSEIRVADRGDRRLVMVLDVAAEKGVKVRRVSNADLDRAARGGVHQGIVADVRDAAHVTVEALVTMASGAPLIVVLDGIEDPHNVGAILRTVDAAGADGVVRQSRHAAPLGGAAAKASAGAVAHGKIAGAVDIARALEQVKNAGVWAGGLA